MTVALYVYMGYSILGLQLAFMLNAVVMILLGVVSWFMLPAETLLKTEITTVSESGAGRYEVDVALA